MSDARTAVGFDRLPWLADEPKPPARGGFPGLSLLAVAAMLLVVGLSYWLWSRAAEQPAKPAVTRTATHSTTVAVPPPQMVEPQVQPDRVPEVQPVPIPTVSLPRAEVQRRPSRKRTEVVIHRGGRSSSRKSVEVSSEAVSLAPVIKPVAILPATPRLWPSRVSQGASGRLVQIGAFGSRYQAKRGWWAMVGAYPALKRLPTVVTDARNSRGRRFYRLQIGTTSQAHSEVLCQLMEKIRYSCAVVGLPWKPKGVER